MSDNLQAPAFLQHLSGTADEGQREALERALLESDELFEQCKALETEAVDAWARGELDSTGARSISNLLSVSPRLQATMETTLALEHRAKNSDHSVGAAPPAVSTPAHTANRWLVFACLLAGAALICSLWALRQQHTLQQQMTRLLHEQAALQAQFDGASEEISRVSELQRALEHYLARQRSGGQAPEQ